MLPKAILDKTSIPAGLAGAPAGPVVAVVIQPCGARLLGSARELPGSAMSPHLGETVKQHGDRHRMKVIERDGRTVAVDDWVGHPLHARDDAGYAAATARWPELTTSVRPQMT